ncbi:MAG: GNAT family N-acetyltransferase [Hyphomicrobium sp.]
MSSLRSIVQKPAHRAYPLLGDREISKIYGRHGPLEVHLTFRKIDLLKAMRLRYEIFYEEMSAKPKTLDRIFRLDRDPYDKICEHLLVFDTRPQKYFFPNSRGFKAIATYRMLHEDVAKKTLGFYTQREYDLGSLLKAKSPHYRFMELGRSCVRKEYRSKRCIELLWQGLWSYAQEQDIDVMIGCASFDGTDPLKYAQALSYLYHYAVPQNDWRCKAHTHLYYPMNLLPKEKVRIDEALKQMPPLIKGYLRLGAFVGEGAVIDKEFGTTDVLIILPIEKINPRYFEYFGHPEEFKLKKQAA